MGKNKWEIGRVKNDAFTDIITLGTAGVASVEVINKETGETREVAVWSGTEEEVRQQAGEQIEKGNFSK